MNMIKTTIKPAATMMMMMITAITMPATAPGANSPTVESDTQQTAC